MRNTLLSVGLCATGASMMPTAVLASTIFPFAGVGNVSAGPCSPTQTDPSACFVLSDVTEAFSVGGVSGYRYEFTGVLVPNPDPDAFPFPTYVGSGTFTLSRGGDALAGSWTNLFVPAPPPAGCDAAAPFGDPDCWTAESMASFDYLITSGAGIYAGFSGTGTAGVDVVTGFPPGNVNPQVGSPYRQSGEFVLHVPEPAMLGLLLVGLLGAAVRKGASRA